jgi:hypothetical protein
MTLFVLSFLTLPAAASPSAAQAMEELSQLVQHIKAVEEIREQEEPGEQPDTAPLMADICYIVTPDGKTQLEHCRSDEGPDVIGTPVEGGLKQALAQAPEAYKSLDPASVLPCSIARRASLESVTSDAVALND